LLHRASRVADGVFGRLVGSALTPRQFVVLATVAENEGLNQMAIMEATGIDRSSVAELVERLVKRKLLQRRRTKRDARSYSVRLTTNAQKLLREMLRAAREADDAVLTGAHQGEALALLSRLALEPSRRLDE
jgi:DNA-binding MarR family transcriptional regulator